jgi:hypothetical protein
LTSLLPICIHLISFSCFIAKNLNTMFHKNEEREHLHFFPDFRGNSFSFPVNYEVVLSYSTFTVLWYILYISICFRFFVKVFFLLLFRWSWDFSPVFMCCVNLIFIYLKISYPDSKRKASSFFRDNSGI